MKKNLPRTIPRQQKDEIKLIAKELAKLNWIEKIILFWSFARASFVLEDITEENWTTRWYRSDYDILIIRKFYKKDFPVKVTDFIRNIQKKYNIERSINIIVEWITHINKMIKQKRYFYFDIFKEWILLFDTWELQIIKDRELLPKEKLKMQKEDFKNWFSTAKNFWLYYETAINNEVLNDSAFFLHQISEKYITAYLLVKTWYRPKTHDLEEFVKFLLKNDDKFWNWFDFDDKEEKRKFELLRKAYVDARYSYNYRITKQEVSFLEEKTSILKEIVEVLCRQEIRKTEEQIKKTASVPEKGTEA